MFWIIVAVITWTLLLAVPLSMARAADKPWPRQTGDTSPH